MKPMVQLFFAFSEPEGNPDSILLRRNTRPPAPLDRKQ
jgi:hypothetical protein